MKGLLIENNDTVRRNGRLVVIEGKEYYIQRVRNSIRLQKNEVKYSDSIGIDWLTIFDSNASEQRVIVELERILRKDAETVSIRKLEVDLNNRESRSIRVSFELQSIFGVIQIEETIG